jgi:hypothetical protein
MSPEERAAMFVKLEHEGPVTLSGTGLKPITEPTDRFTLAVPREANLDRFASKVEEFGEGEIRRGHAPHERLVPSIRTVQRGDPKDRLSQALYEVYDSLVAQEWVVCEIEMISLVQSRNQQRSELLRIRTALDQAFANGIHGTMFEHEEIKGTCRAVIRCTGGMFRQLVEGQEWQVRISWFDARPEFETFHATLRDFQIEQLGGISKPNDAAPVVCIVDSGVTSGNPFLQPVTREDLLLSFLQSAPDEPYDGSGHGSGVASLASYYALNLSRDAVNEGKVWIAGARVLDANNNGDGRLFSKVLTEVVETFVPHGVRIFNLSVNIINRLWNREAKRTIPRRSWIARTIDRLSREHDVIFVISAGNMKPTEVEALIQDGHPYPNYLAHEDACIFDPGQAALALTVGAIAPTTLAVGRAATGMAMAERSQPAPFTRCGPGIRREIKPELVELGGNYLINEGGQVRLNPGMNVVMASHQLTPPISHASGTSFAAPRVTYKLALTLADLESIGMEYVSAPLLKALLVNSATYEPLGEEFKQFVETLNEVQAKHWLNVVGYGFPDHNRATDCDAHSALLFFQGELKPNKVAYFDLPIPASLAQAEPGIKRLTITVTHDSEVQRWGLEQYLGTSFKWRLFRGDVSREDIIRGMSVEDDEGNAVEAEDGEDNQPEEEPTTQAARPNEVRRPLLGINFRSRGAIQHDVYEWHTHRAHYSASSYTLAVAAYEKWGRENPDSVPYAVVVRLEDTTRTSEIYTEVQNILTRVQVRA